MVLNPSNSSSLKQLALTRLKIAKTHGRRSVGGQVDISATFWSGGYALCFVPPPFSGVDNFCTNVQLHSTDYIAVFVC